jgi:hypothetical protein
MIPSVVPMKEYQMDYEKMTAPCGLACFNCVVHLAQDDPDLGIKVSKQFGIPEKDVGCPGCRDVQGKCPVTPMECSVYPCAQEKGITFCCYCPDFPCDSLHPYADQAASLPHNTKVFNLCLIKKMGVEAWAKHKAKSVKEVYFRGKWRM